MDETKVKDLIEKYQLTKQIERNSHEDFLEQ